jgi:type II secretory pathway component PulC
MKIKKFYILLSLIIFVIIIWIFNIRYISNITTHTNEPQPKTSTSFFSPESILNSGFKFKPLKNDPFNVVVDTGPEEPQMPTLSLKGLVLARDGALALMELPDGNVYPMKQGEKYLGVKIKKITPKEVIVEFRGKKEIFTVWE